MNKPSSSISAHRASNSLDISTKFHKIIRSKIHVGYPRLLLTFRLLLSRLISVSFILVITGCASGPKTYVITQKALQNKLASQLKEPINIHPLLTLKIQHPLVSLDDVSNRLRTSLEVELISPLRKTPTHVDMTISGTLSYEASTQQIQLTQTQLESFKVPELSNNAKLMSWVENAVKTFHEQSLNVIPFYQFKKDELKLGGQAYEPLQFTIKSKQLEVQLVPSK